jgi:DNA-binding NarL/FixJ family response regulator
VGRRVLIVDDHPSFRASARRVLEADDYAVVGEAADLASGREKVRELHPELVLLDVHLPDGDGCDLAAELTSSDDPPAVVMVSSRPAEEIAPRAQASGAAGFVAKAELSGDAIAALLAGPTAPG